MYERTKCTGFQYIQNTHTHTHSQASVVGLYTKRVYDIYAEYIRLVYVCLRVCVRACRVSGELAQNGQRSRREHELRGEYGACSGVCVCIPYVYSRVRQWVIYSALGAFVCELMCGWSN